MRIYEKIEKSIHESKFVHQEKFKGLSNFWSRTRFDFFFPINFLNLKINQNSFSSIIINMWFGIIGNYTSEKINRKNRIIVQNVWIKIKLYLDVKATWQLSYTWFIIFWAFRQPEKTGHKYQKQAGIHREYY